MKLKEFVENNLEQNSIFRVVAEIPGGHYVLGKNWEENLSVLFFFLARSLHLIRKIITKIVL